VPYLPNAHYLGYAIYQGKTLGESVKFAIVVLQRRPDGSTRTGKEFLPYLRRDPKVGVLSKFLDLLMNPLHSREVNHISTQQISGGKNLLLESTPFK
jgi:hypothetical protein